MTGPVGLSIYRFVSKLMGIALWRHEIVECVYANHGVGRGEITFGRSDIDLTMIVRTPDPETGDGEKLYSLFRRFSALRRINPAMSHIMVNDPGGYDRWLRVDTYNGSQERRTLLLLAGRPIQVPNPPVRRDDAIRRIPFWTDRFLSPAVQQHNSRIARKMAIEVWKAWAVAGNIAREPFLTMIEAKQQLGLHPFGSDMAEAGDDPRRITGFIMKLAGILHDAILPPLKKINDAMVFPLPMLPRSPGRTLIVLPHPGAPLPAAAFRDQPLLATPEMLHLYIHYLNPFFDWNLPRELRRLGFKPPSYDAFLRACLFYGQDSMWRRPGFIGKDGFIPCLGLAFNKYSIPYLRNDETPPPMPEETVRAILARNPTCSEFYRREFARFYRESMEQMQILQQLEARESIQQRV